MNIAILKNTICVNIAVFDDILTAKTFLANGDLLDADEVIELPNGYGIEDNCVNGIWTKAQLTQELIDQ